MKHLSTEPIPDAILARFKHQTGRAMDDDETVVKLGTGWSLKSGPATAFETGGYVLLCRPDGKLCKRWPSQAWANKPAEVMAEIIGAAACCEALSTPLENDEVVVALADGWTLRSGVYARELDDKHVLACGEYVRLCKPDGEEYAYWDQDEWKCDPELVMGAIINSAAGLRFVDGQEGS